MGIKGMILAGLFAASMSTISADLNSISAVILDDFYFKLAPEASEEQRLWFSRINILVLGVLGVALAIALIRIESMVDTAFNFVSVISGGLLGLYFLGFFAVRAVARALVLGSALACSSSVGRRIPRRIPTSCRPGFRITGFTYSGWGFWGIL